MALKRFRDLSLRHKVALGQAGQRQGLGVSIDARPCCNEDRLRKAAGQGELTYIERTIGVGK